jgi:RNA polymerase sigma factor for flagellar operon FliA
MSNRPLDSQELQPVWEEFLETRASVARARLIGAYLDFACKTAQKVIKDARVHGEMDGEEHLQAGVIGLLQAVDAYRPREAVSFETFCFLKIKGAVLDQISAFESSHRLWMATPRSPDGPDPFTPDAEQPKAGPPASAPRAPGDWPEIPALVHRHPKKLSLSQPRRAAGHDGDETSWTEALPDRRTREPFNELARREVKEIVIRHCTEVERLVLVLRYYENMTMEEIATAIGRTESRVSQIHKVLLDKLRRRLRDQKEELLAVAG